MSALNRILVINPNSIEAMTHEIDRAVAPLRLEGGPAIECVTLTDGPPGIQSQRDADSAVLPICNYIRKHDSEASAFVIACFSDPGLYAAREVTSKPVFGIAECAMAVALTQGDRFGIISILDNAIARHRRMIRATGLESRFAADFAIGVGVPDLGKHDLVLERMIGIGNPLKKDHGAGVLSRCRYDGARLCDSY
jgi:Asp/Glu/hydantoin racemase